MESNIKRPLWIGATDSKVLAKNKGLGGNWQKLNCSGHQSIVGIAFVNWNKLFNNLGVIYFLINKVLLFT